MTCETSINVEAQRHSFLDQEWLLWRCDVKYVNILYLDNHLFYAQNITLQYGEILWSRCPRCSYPRSLGEGPNTEIEIWFGGQRFIPLNTINTLYGKGLNDIKFSIQDDFCSDNNGFFEVIVTLGQKSKNLEIDNNLKTQHATNDAQSQAIGDMTKAFHELFGKFASLERQLDEVQGDFRDFRAAECKGRERECEELMGNIRAKREDGQNDSEL